MPNPFVLDRLTGIQNQLMGLHRGSTGLSSATKGREREDLIDRYLAQVFPTHYRFGDGDITDINENKSGQVEIVVEYPFFPSFPMIGANSRLYLAEGVAAVIEVKSSLDPQWEQVTKTAAAVKKLQRNFGATGWTGLAPKPEIPFFAVGYTGWRDPDTLKDKLKDQNIDSILVIENGLFASNQYFGGVRGTGAWALWGLIQCLHLATSSLKMASGDLVRYTV
jgi:hypothetical protein